MKAHEDLAPSIFGTSAKEYLLILAAQAHFLLSAQRGYGAGHLHKECSLLFTQDVWQRALLCIPRSVCRVVLYAKQPWRSDCARAARAYLYGAGFCLAPREVLARPHEDHSAGRTPAPYCAKTINNL